MASHSSYERIIEWLFAQGYSKGAKEVPVRREDILKAIKKLKLKQPKNLGDVIYSYRYRKALPKSISDTYDCESAPHRPESHFLLHSPSWQSPRLVWVEIEQHHSYQEGAAQRNLRIIQDVI